MNRICEILQIKTNLTLCCRLLSIWSFNNFSFCWSIRCISVSISVSLSPSSRCSKLSCSDGSLNVLKSGAARVEQMKRMAHSRTLESLKALLLPNGWVFAMIANNEIISAYDQGVFRYHIYTLVIVKQPSKITCLCLNTINRWSSPTCLLR